MTNQERAEKMFYDTEFKDAEEAIAYFTFQLDEAVREAIESFILNTIEEDPRLRFFREKYKAQGFAAARKKAAGMCTNTSEGIWMKQRIRAMEPDK